MNKYWILFVWMLLWSVGCATIQRREILPGDAVPISQMIENPSKWDDVGKGIAAGKEYIFRIEKGQRIPIKLLMGSPIGTLEKSENIFSFDRDVYLLISKENMQVSPDGLRWAHINSMGSLKKLFGFKQGHVSVGFGATKEEGTFISLDVGTK